ncbi:LmeA family phospholipid-binding protein [Streptomyces sp. NPDC098781]|uniref:LmeA family phospholipid-binding protein n=1 Tax=Streptomyces sp. NPDC098781 TaxID=3366097 RepID=UPI00382A28EF
MITARPLRPRVRGILRTRRRVTACVALAALLLTTAAAELGARALLESRIAGAAGRVLGSDSEVEIEGGPALAALIEGHADAVTVSSDDATLGRMPDVSVAVRLEDLSLRSDGATVARTQAHIEVPAASVLSLAAASGGRLPVSGVHPDEAAGTLTLTLGQGGLGSATLRPEIEEGRVTLYVDSAEVLGRPAPAAMVERIRHSLSERTDRPYPLGLRATSLDVTATGLKVALKGGGTRLPTKDTTV